MTVLHVVRSIDRSFGGEGLAAFKLAENTNTSLVVVGPHTKDDKWKISDEFSGRLFYQPSLIRLIYSILFGKFGDIKIIHLHGAWYPSYFFICCLSKLVSLRVLMSPHGCFGDWALSHKRYKKLVAMFLYQRLSVFLSDGLVANSDLERSDLHAIFPSANIFNIRNGIDVDDFDGGAGEDKVRPSSESNAYTFLFLSRLSPVKGIEDLLVSWSNVFGGSSRSILVIAGSGPCNYVKSLQELAVSLDISSSVEFVGEVGGSHKEDLFVRSDVFILPSKGENFGIVIAEAMHHKLPVITTTNTPWSCVEYEKLGWFVDSTVSALADALKMARCTEKTVLEAMGYRGQQYVLRHFTWELAAKEAMNVYNFILTS